jgi:hypothetical protein
MQTNVHTTLLSHMHRDDMRALVENSCVSSMDIDDATCQLRTNANLAAQILHTAAQCVEMMGAPW